MRRLLLAVLLAGLLSTAPAAAITFGQIDGNAHPKVGALVVRLHDQNRTLIPICSGTMVSENVFLTAGHCTFLPDVFFGPGNYDLGATFLTDLSSLDEGDVTFGEGHTHPAFFPNAANASKNAVDIGVVVLDGDPGVGSVQLPDEELLDRIDLRAASFTTVGYGAVREVKTNGPQALLPNALRRFAVQSASHVNGSWLKLSMNPSTGNGGTCFGDSGGPHFLEDTEIIVSVTSHGDSPCRSSDWTARVDTSDALDFVRAYTD
jgi:Trypsin